MPRVAFLLPFLFFCFDNNDIIFSGHSGWETKIIVWMLCFIRPDVLVLHFVPMVVQGK